MEFDKSRVYTSLNADELRAGDMVIVGDTITFLKRNTNNNKIYELIEVKNEDYSNRFIVDIGLGVGFALAYLVERKENCTNCDEGKWDAEHKKILCDPVHCGNGNIIFRNHETEVCEYWKPKTKQKAEPHYRPFKDTDELIKVWCDKGGKWQKRELTMPLIWVHRDDTYEECLIVTFDNDGVYLGHRSVSLHELWEHFTFLDGSPCGVEE